MNQSKKQRTVAIQKSLETREKFPISYFDSRQYIQHNLNLEDGLGPILAFMDSLPADNTKVAVRRSFEDGDYSVAHADYVLGDWGPMVGFEIHRWENDRIVEHWDNLQATPTSGNRSGRSMTDGAFEVSDLEQTATNKSRAGSFTREILIDRNLAGIGQFFSGEHVIQHSPDIEDGVAALSRHLASTSGISWLKVHKVLGEGNFVLVMSEGKRLDEPLAIFDLYRFEGNLIAEHWDVVEIIPPRTSWKNSNGKF